MKTGFLLSLLLPLWLWALPVAAGPPSPARSALEHRVAKGESLYAIARQAGITVAELKRLNHLKSDLIRPGTVLQLRRNPDLLSPGVRLSPVPVVSAEPAPEDSGVSTGTLAESSSLPAVEGDLQAAAFAFLSTPYRFGADSRQATDCSGFTQQVFRDLGLAIPRTAREQFRLGMSVAADDWQAGDLLFFRTYAGYPSHVGIYLSEGKMIHASRSRRQVVISNANIPYFRKRYLGARRLADFDPVGSLIESLAGRVSEVNEEGMLEADLPEAEAAPPLSEQALIPPQ